MLGFEYQNSNIDLDIVFSREAIEWSGSKPPVLLSFWYFGFSNVLSFFSVTDFPNILSSCSLKKKKRVLMNE